jgi:arylformamidase
MGAGVSPAAEPVSGEYPETLRPRRPRSQVHLMRFIDLSQPIFDGSPNCPAHPPVQSVLLKDHPECGWRVELLTLSNHTGSHVDAPLHKIAGGASLDDIPLERWAGPAFIADLRGLAPDSRITAAMLENALPDELTDAIVLLATGWGDKRAKTDEWLYHSPCPSEDGARWLVGIDHFSIGGGTEPINERVHTILLGSGMWIVEELKFPAEVFTLPQPVRYMGLPVNLKSHTGAFCRPVLINLPACTYFDFRLRSYSVLRSYP